MMLQFLRVSVTICQETKRQKGPSDEKQQRKISDTVTKRNQRVSDVVP